ncbi:hypothetical protein KP509_14G060600 [Ceratopteris richardii]|uniref:Uncharacterized protein n=1 Tax=Ceratopteris richardii TaxID=49495 RepID=A0A8T2TC91_CERRI|nr:hypothetical protein KP509_14G060600 [Ceratopteris richardii]
MEDIGIAEAQLKRKPEAPLGDVESKKPRECLPSNAASAARASENSQEEAPAQTNGNCNSALSTYASGYSKETNEEAHKVPETPAKPVEVDGSTQAPGSSSEPLQELNAPKYGNFEDDKGDKSDSDGEKSELDTENDSEVDDEYGSEEGDTTEDSDNSDDDSNKEEHQEYTVSSSTSSLHSEMAQKSKGKERVDDVKGKGILVVDKGKGKAIAEDDNAPVSDEDDPGYLSEDLLEEVDLNNILPTRTRRRSTTHQYDFVNQGSDDDDDDDSDA